MPFPDFWQNPTDLRHVPGLGMPDTLKDPGINGQKTENSYCYEIVMSVGWGGRRPSISMISIENPRNYPEPGRFSGQKESGRARRVPGSRLGLGAALRQCSAQILMKTQHFGLSRPCRMTAAKVPAQDGLLARASKKLVSDEGLLPELGPARLDRELQKYIWSGKDHLFLKGYCQIKLT